MTETTDKDAANSTYRHVCYHIDRLKDGFLLYGNDRCSVAFTLEPTCIRLASEGRSARFGLLCYRDIVRWAAAAAMQSWRSPRTGSEYCPGWVSTATAKSLNVRIYPLWKELIARADPAVFAVHRRAFAANFRVPALCLEDALYRERHIVEDIIKYPAAAMAARYVDCFAREMPWIYERFPYAKRRREAYERLRASAFEPASSCEEVVENETENMALWLALMRDWKAMFTPDGRTYGSLNKTLTNVHCGITPGILCNLAYVRLMRPVYDRLELMTIGAAAECRRRHHDAVYAYATHDEIRRAMAVVSGTLRHTVLSSRRTQDIVFFTRYLSDFLEIHNGRIVGLAQKAVRWHRDQMERHYETTLESIGLARNTAMPPVPLPEVDGITFLSTVGQIAEEGKRMEHCVTSYATDAVHGLCYLFHAEHAGDMATIEVGPSGQVLQARGPGNCCNGAAAWGSEVLRIWGERFPLQPAPNRRVAVEDPDPPF